MESLPFFALILVFGAAPSPIAFLMIPAGLLGGLAFGAVLMGYASTLEEDTGQLAMVMRFVVLPMTLFSGTFFPLSSFPVALQWIGWISPLWHSTELARVFSYGYAEPILQLLIRNGLRHLRDSDKRRPEHLQSMK